MKTACAEAHADLSCDEPEVAPGRRACVRWGVGSRYRSPHGEGHPLQARCGSGATLHNVIFPGAKRELHAALSSKKPQAAEPSCCVARPGTRFVALGMAQGVSA
jgi:hypothetical protein